MNISGSIRKLESEYKNEMAYWVYVNNHNGPANLNNFLTGFYPISNPKSMVCDCLFTKLLVIS